MRAVMIGGDDERVVDQLRRALETRTVIGQAVGMLMERHRLDGEAAFSQLSRLASARRLKVHELAAEMVQSASTSAPATSSAAPTGSSEATAAALPLPTPGLVTDPALLSDREREVLSHIAAGASNQEVAEALYLGMNTVKTYIRTAYRKIGATRRTQAMLWAQRHGLQPPADGGSPGPTAS